MECCAGIPTPLGIMAVSTTGVGRSLMVAGLRIPAVMPHLLFHRRKNVVDVYQLQSTAKSDNLGPFHACGEIG